MSYRDDNLWYDNWTRLSNKEYALLTAKNPALQAFIDKKIHFSQMLSALTVIVGTKMSRTAATEVAKNHIGKPLCITTIKQLFTEKQLYNLIFDQEYGYKLQER